MYPKPRKIIFPLYEIPAEVAVVPGPLTKQNAEMLLAVKTCGGTRNTKYADRDYYAIFPEDTRMLHTPEFRGR